MSIRDLFEHKFYGCLVDCSGLLHWVLSGRLEACMYDVKVRMDVALAQRK